MVAPHDGHRANRFVPPSETDGSGTRNSFPQFGQSPRSPGWTSASSSLFFPQSHHARANIPTRGSRRKPEPSSRSGVLQENWAAARAGGGKPSPAHRRSRMRAPKRVWSRKPPAQHPEKELRVRTKKRKAAADAERPYPPRSGAAGPWRGAPMRARATESTAMSAGVTPGTREAWPRLWGRMRESFSRDSNRRAARPW